MSPIDHPITRRFIEDAGNTTQALGVGRVVGQIFAYLYFSEESRTLDDMKGALGISKGSASMGVRQLEQWGAVQRVWVKGDRKDFYTANDYFGQIVRNIATDLMGKRLASLSASLDAAEGELLGCQVPQLLSESPASPGELLSCSADKLLSESPAGSPSSTTKQPNNSTTGRASGATKQPNNSTTGRASGATQQPNNPTTDFLRTRVRRLRDFQSKVNSTWNNPIVKLMLK
jgi:DNA-binding transcriptional regulator GbsR (MarR family)